MTFDNVLSLLDAGAGKLVTVPGPIAGIAASSTAPILSTEGDLPNCAEDGSLCVSNRDGKLYIASGGKWFEISSGAGE